MSGSFKKLLSFILIFSLVASGLPGGAMGKNFFVKGEASAAEAANTASPTNRPSPLLRSIPAFRSQPDSTETLLFEEDEERNLVKEITVWIIGAAFVGYFIVKVFLEGDTEETVQEKPKKEIPGSSVTPVFLSFPF